MLPDRSVLIGSKLVEKIHMRHFQLFLNNEIGHLLYASSQFYSHLVALARKRVKLAMQDLNTSQNPLIFCSIVAGVTTNFIFYIPSFLCCTLSWNSSNHFRLTKKLLLLLHFCVKCGKKVFAHTWIIALLEDFTPLPAASLIVFSLFFIVLQNTWKS